MLYAQREEVIDERGDADDDGEPFVPGGVETETGDEQQLDAAAPPGDRPVNHQQHGEKDHERDGAKQHRHPLGRIETKIGSRDGWGL